MFVADIDQYARTLPYKSPPVMVAHPELGQIGLALPGKGFQLRGMRSSELEALLADERRELIRQLQIRHELRCVISSWDGVLNARTNGRYWDFLGTKVSQTVVANAWSSFYRSTGTPGAGAYTAIPTGAVHNRASAGAFPLKNPATGNKTYLVNVGVQHPTGPNVVLWADLLVAAGTIDTNATGAQTVNSAALTRYTTGEGVLMTFEVTATLGATPANMTVSYTNQAGTAARSTGAVAMTTSAIAFRLLPVSNGVSMVLQGDDYGVRSVQSVTMANGMGSGGIIALNLFKPLLLIPTLSTISYVERSTPGMLSGITELIYGTDNQLGCLVPYVLASTTSTGLQTNFVQSVEG